MTDWSSRASKTYNEHGSKARVGQSEPKSPYSEWHRTLGAGCYANDIDWIEWRVTAAAGRQVVAVIETTFYKDKPELRHFLPNYCASVLARFKRDAQHDIVTLVAAALNVPAYFVIAREDLKVFFVCRLSDESWKQMSEPLYRRWLMWLGQAVAA